MVDISMCGNDLCPSRLSCYRYRAMPSLRQSYMVFDFGADDRCGSFWDIKFAPTRLKDEADV